MRRREFDDEDRGRRRDEDQGHLCETCGERSGTKRFFRGEEMGIHCNGCWQEILNDADKDDEP